MRPYRENQYHAKGVNRYVPQMSGVARISLDGEILVSLGNPPNALATGILSAVADATVYTPTNFVQSVGFDGAKGEILNAPWGRNLTVVGSGAQTGTVVIKARDYLGQPFTENIALNGATPVAGVKAARWVDSITIPEGGSSTINVGYGNVLGLPYFTVEVNKEFADGLAAGAGTFVAGVTTDPQTATTGDPRGTYVPSTTPDGVKEITVQLRCSARVNANNNGGYHGIRHFAA